MAIRARAGHLGLRKKQHRWLASEVSKLRKLWVQGTTRAEICAALPQFSWQQIRFQARDSKIPRPKHGLKPTGHPILDQIRERAKSLNLSMRDVDQMVQSTGYFERERWRNTSLPQSPSILRAIRALDGDVSVIWR
jgi:hypothetical protein